MKMALPSGQNWTTLYGSLGTAVTLGLVAPYVNTYIDTVTGDARLTGVVDAAIGVGLLLLSKKLSDGWAVMAIGVGVGFALEGAVRIVMPSVAANAAASKQSAFMTALAQI